MLCTTICYIIQDDQVLLLHRNKKEQDVSEGKYIGIGGKVDPGESPRQCIIREVQEEAGIAILDPVLRGVISFPNFAGRDELMFLYVATEYTGTLQPCNEGTLEWVALSDWDSVPMWPGDRVFLPWVWEGSFFEATFFYNESLEFQGHEVAFSQEK